MKKLNGILELLKDNPLSIEDLKAHSQLPGDDKFSIVIELLKNQKFIEVKDDKVSITRLGLTVLELPPEELYEGAEIKAGDDGIKAMAERFGIRKEDVIHAVWAGGKDTVWAKLTMDLKEKKEARKRDGKM